MYHSVSTGIFSNTGHCHHYSAQSSYFTCAEYNALIIETLIHIGLKKVPRDWEYLQQTELKSAPSYPSESTAVLITLLLLSSTK